MIPTMITDIQPQLSLESTIMPKQLPVPNCPPVYVKKPNRKINSFQPDTGGPAASSPTKDPSAPIEITPARNPDQPIIEDAIGIPRFRSNKIVEHVYAIASNHGKVDLDQPEFSNDDRCQFLQLLGSSVQSYSQLPCVIESRPKDYNHLSLGGPAFLNSHLMHNARPGQWMIYDPETGRYKPSLTNRTLPPYSTTEQAVMRRAVEHLWSAVHWGVPPQAGIDRVPINQDEQVSQPGPNQSPENRRANLRHNGSVAYSYRGLSTDDVKYKFRDSLLETPAAALHNLSRNIAGRLARDVPSLVGTSFNDLTQHIYEAVMRYANEVEMVNAEALPVPELVDQPDQPPPNPIGV